MPVPHFQVVFTVDHLVNELAYINPQPIYDLLFATANQVLKEFAQRYLGGKVGVTAVLHTWGPDDAAPYSSALYGDRWGVGQYN